MPRVWSDASASDDPGRDRNEQIRKAQQARTSRRAEGAAVGERGMRFHSKGSAKFQGGGGVRIEDGGSMVLIDDQGVTLAFFGQFADGTFGWTFRYDSDDPLFTRQGTPGQQFWGFWDQHRNLIFTSDGLTGSGLGRPFLNIPMYPSTGTSIGTGGPFWPEFVNASYQEVMHGITTLWHPRIRVGVATNTASGTVDWQLRIDGTVFISGSGTGSGTSEIPGWGSTIKPGGQHSVQLWCRNTTGTASRVITDYCYGLES